MTTRDRLASARQSSNLADKPDRLTDVSVLAAAGMVATGQAVGMALLRLRDSLDAKSWPTCLAAVSTRTRTLCSSLDPKISEREQHDLAEHILRRWVAPTCPACSGRRYETIIGTPHMSDRPCQRCRGAGSLSIDAGLPAAQADVARDVAEWMDAQVHCSNGRLGSKMRG